MADSTNFTSAQKSALDLTKGETIPLLHVEISALKIIAGATAARDWQPLHHDHQWAVEKAKTGGIILNTPTQAGWITKYLTDWFGPQARVGKMRFKMRSSILPGHTMSLQGAVKAIEAAGECGSWVQVDVNLMVEEKPATIASVCVAIPTCGDGPNPWRCAKSLWRPRWLKE